MAYSRLSQSIQGAVLTGEFDRGRYATDASIYQIMPRAVVVPKTWSDVEATLDFARAQGLPVLSRGAGTSQAGQTVNDALVIDFTKHLNRVLDYDPQAGTVRVEPGLVLDDLNRRLRRDGWWFPVDVSTASRATLGGMAANNSCGSRSIRYGMMRGNVIGLDAMLADGTIHRFGAAPRDHPLDRDLIALARGNADEIRRRFPNVARRVGGYNLDALLADPPNMAALLVGSEGTLAVTRSLDLRLAPLPQSKALGVCHFPSFRAAMDAAQHIVTLGPVAVELVDHNMIRLGRDIPQFRPIVDEFVRGDPQALLLVEFAETPDENRRRLAALEELMAGLGFRWGDPGKDPGGVIQALDPAFQKRIWGVRTQGLNIMMSMRSAAKPVSFVEDCAVPLPHLADFTDRLTALFRKHDTDGTWYAHASVGLLHVRPVLNLRQDLGLRQLRGIAEEAFDIVAEYKGSHSGEHGDGIVRSEFHERMFGAQMVRLFEQVKHRFDPQGLLNPGKITNAPKMDDRRLMRWPPGAAPIQTTTVYDWSGWPGGLGGAAEMCNNNGACRKSTGGGMCPSFRVTGNERDLTRGRANVLRLAMTGQLDGGLGSDDMTQAMALCVGCKACASECPMSIDMARMKTETQAARAAQHGLRLRDRAIAHLPQIAPLAARLYPLANAARVFAPMLGFARGRSLPAFHWPFAGTQDDSAQTLLFADTFNRYFEPQVLRAAQRVIGSVGVAGAPGPALCCGRTYLSVGLVDRARAQLTRTTEVFRRALDQGKTIVGVEPSCTLMFRDEAPDLVPGWTADMGARVLTLAEYLNQAPPYARPPTGAKALVHGHCHQKAQGIAPLTQTALTRAGLKAQMIDSACCGMAGAFGYQAETAQVSRDMAELTLAPALRAAGPGTTIVADGFSCRHQIRDTTGARADHLAVVLDRLGPGAPEC